MAGNKTLIYTHLYTFKLLVIDQNGKHPLRIL
jgi:hypothetical protein